MEDLKKRRAYDAPSFVRDVIDFTHEWIASDNLHTFSSEAGGGESMGPVGEAIEKIQGGSVGVRNEYLM